ncbi:hypothetical protein HDU96_003742 [Phlyctochytrium bullatum]|nr:hypothetical protein HDU96_003742 [Phlyctochytrium bullatum]
MDTAVVIAKKPSQGGGLPLPLDLWHPILLLASHSPHDIAILTAVHPHLRHAYWSSSSSVAAYLHAQVMLKSIIDPAPYPIDASSPTNQGFAACFHPLGHPPPLTQRQILGRMKASSAIRVPRNPFHGVHLMCPMPPDAFKNLIEESCPPAAPPSPTPSGWRPSRGDSIATTTRRPNQQQQTFTSRSSDAVPPVASHSHSLGPSAALLLAILHLPAPLPTLSHLLRLLAGSRDPTLAALASNGFWDDAFSVAIAAGDRVSILENLQAHSVPTSLVALETAAEHGALRCLAYILATAFDTPLNAQRRRHIANALLRATKAGQDPAVAVLLRHIPRHPRGTRPETDHFAADVAAALAEACKLAHTPIVARLLDASLPGDPDAPLLLDPSAPVRGHPLAWTPLHFAVACTPTPAIKPILALPGCQPASTPDAARRAAVIRLLLAHPSVSVDPRDVHGLTPLSWASSAGHLPVVQLLLDRGADLNPPPVGDPATPVTNPLARAMANGHAEVALHLLDATHATTTDLTAARAATFAALCRRTHLLPQLCHRGTPIQPRGIRLAVSLLAAAASTPSAARHAVATAFGSPTPSGPSPFAMLCGNGTGVSDAVVAEAVRAVLAAVAGDEAAVTALFRADPTTGCTPLHAACGHIVGAAGSGGWHRPRPAVVAALLEAGVGKAVVEARAADGATALFAALGTHGCVEAGRRLMAAGADVGVVDGKGASVLHAAAAGLHVGAMRAVVEAMPGVVGARDEKGGTALHVVARAVLAGRAGEAAGVLVEAGVEVAATDGEGKMAWEIAGMREVKEMLRALVEG